MRICIIQTGSWGDNINSTLMLKPLKSHYDNAKIIVHTSTIYASAFYNNPYIDEIVEHQATSKNEALGLAKTIEKTIKSTYDIVINHHPLFDQNRTSQLHPELGVNLVYSWVRALEELNVLYELPLETTLKLRDTEVEKTREYIANVKDFNSKRKVLMEVHGESGQTHWNDDWTTKTIRHLSDDNTLIFVSKKSYDKRELDKLKSIYTGVNFVGCLSIRECAELFNHCDIFLSVSSGLSNACNTDWCRKDIKWVEAVNSITASSAAIRREGKDFWFDNNLDGYLNCLRSNGI